MNDIFCHICTYLRDIDKLNFLSVSSFMHQLTSRVFFNDQIQIKKIINIWYFDRFTNIITDQLDVYPKCISHLTFGHRFDKNINGCIPPSTTHLTFGSWFDHDIDGCIPPSTTHLTFGSWFDHDIKGCVPPSVTHLTFGSYFNQDIDGCIPPNVTHLTLPQRYKTIDHNIKCHISYII